MFIVECLSMTIVSFACIFCLMLDLPVTGVNCEGKWLLTY